MENRWYYEMRSPTGRTRGQVHYGGRPPSRTAAGVKIRYTHGPVQIAEEDYDMNLSQLSAKYGPRDSMDEDITPTNTTDDEAKKEPKTPDTPLERLDGVAQAFDGGFQRLMVALRSLPDSRQKALAITYIETGVLWAEQAFNHTRSALHAKAEYEQFQREKQGNGA